MVESFNNTTWGLGKKLQNYKKSHNFATQFSADNWTFITITILMVKINNMVNINKFPYWSLFKFLRRFQEKKEPTQWFFIVIYGTVLLILNDATIRVPCWIHDGTVYIFYLNSYNGNNHVFLFKKVINSGHFLFDSEEKIFKQKTKVIS